MSFTAHGAVPDQDDPRDHMGNLPMDMTMADLPPTFDVTVNTPDGLDAPYKAHCFDQANIGSCVPNAVALAYMYELQRQKQPDAYKFKPSRLFLYYVARFAAGNATSNLKVNDVIKAAYFKTLSDQPPAVTEMFDDGSQPRDVIKIMLSLGAPEEADSVADYLQANAEGRLGTWPYQPATVVAPNTEATTKVTINGTVKDKFTLDTDYVVKAPDSKCFEVATTHEALNYSRPRFDLGKSGETIECWKACIKSGYPIIFCFKVVKSFWNHDPRDAPFILQVPTPAEIQPDNGGHCVVAIGWDNSKGAFLIQNSWGDKKDGKPAGIDGKGRNWLPYAWFDVPGALYSPWSFMKGALSP
ncbi:Fc.00g115140.m01.CDS01 [Cosmosporella sp. VM-42]